MSTGTCWARSTTTTSTADVQRLHEVHRRARSRGSAPVHQEQEAPTGQVHLQLVGPGSRPGINRPCSDSSRVAGGSSTVDLGSTAPAAAAPSRPTVPPPALPAAAPPAPAAPPTALAAPVPYTLGPGHQCLLRNEFLRSKDGRYSLYMQADGDVVLSSPTRVLWRSNTGGTDGSSLCQLGNGLLVIWDSAVKPIWAAGTRGSGGDRLMVQDDGNLVMHTPAYLSVWASNTGDSRDDRGVLRRDAGASVVGVHDGRGRWTLMADPVGNEVDVSRVRGARVAAPPGTGGAKPAAVTRDRTDIGRTPPLRPGNTHLVERRSSAPVPGSVAVTGAGT